MEPFYKPLLRRGHASPLEAENKRFANSRRQGGFRESGPVALDNMERGQTGRGRSDISTRTRQDPAGRLTVGGTTVYAANSCWTKNFKQPGYAMDHPE